MQRVITAISGLGLLYIGSKIILTGGFYVKGVYSDFSEFKVPVGIVFILFGVFIIVASMITKRTHNQEESKIDSTGGHQK